MEGALGDLGEDFVEGVNPLLQRLVTDGNHLGAITGELTTQEHVHQVNLEKIKRGKICHKIVKTLLSQGERAMFSLSLFYHNLDFGVGLNVIVEVEHLIFVNTNI